MHLVCSCAGWAVQCQQFILRNVLLTTLPTALGANNNGGIMRKDYSSKEKGELEEWKERKSKKKRVRELLLQ